MKNPILQSVLRITLLYALLSGLWIFLSDRLLLKLASDIYWLTQWQTYKDWFFVVVTAVGLFVLLWTRRRAEEARKESEEKYRAVVNNIDEIVYLVETPRDAMLNWKIGFVSRRVENLLGYKANEFLDEPALWFRLLHPDDVSTVMEVGKKILSTRSPGTHLYRLRHKESGEYRWLEDRVVPQLDASGNVTGYLGTARDVTERKYAEDLLRESEETSHTLVDANPESVLLMNTEGIIIAANKTLAHRLGKDIKEIVGQNIYALLPLDAVEERKRQAAEVIALGQAVRFEDKRGDRFVDNYIHPVFDAQGKVIRLAILGIDITERKQAEAALRESGERFRVALATINMAVFNQDRDLRYTWMYQPQMGYVPEQVVGKTDEELLPRAAAEQVTQIKQAVIDTGVGAWEEVGVTVDRDTSYYHLIVEPLRDDTGEVIGITGASLDITERKQAEQTLLESEHHFRTLFENMLDGYAHCRIIYEDGHPRDFLYLDVNQAFEALTGLKNVVGRKVSEVIPGLQESNPEIFEIYGRVASTGLPEKFETNVDALGIWFSIFVYCPEEGEFVAVFDNITERKQAEEKIQRQLEHLAALRDIDRIISSSFDLRLSLSELLKHAVGQLSIDAADILVLNPSTQTLEYAAGNGFRTTALQHTHLPLGQGYAGKASLERQTIHVSNLRRRKTDFLRSPNFKSEDFDTYFGVPLIAKGSLKGVLEVFQRSPLEPNQEWLDFLNMLAGQAAIAIDNATLFENLQRSNLDLELAYDATIEGWSSAMDLRDKETEGHTQRVTEMSTKLGRAFGLSDEQLVHVRRGALLHDIGKMGVPDKILLKPGALTDDEWVLMRKHPTFAYEMLVPIKYLHPALDIPYCHHEKWDGTGYPRGLKGEQIPLTARIFAVVDVWDALTSDRPYRPAWTKKKALEYIHQGAGGHFDSRVVEKFIRMILDDE